ncbi:MAG: acyl-CoA dehydrogenase family protein [Chloroflexi bacterium]|nr:acyl-CoA dehydrogenase family protein [Chloroflexota bacterium]
MDFDFTSEQSAFREELGQFLATEVPLEKQQIFGVTSDDQYKFGREINRKLAARNWLAVGLPEEYGGGKGPIEQGILDEELGYYRVPESGSTGLNVVAPAIMAFGTQAQKEVYLKPIAHGEIEFCQGIDDTSGPASAQLVAERDGDEYVLNGVSRFTSYAIYADYMCLLARTSPEAQDTSLFIVDMKTSGIRLESSPFINGQMAAKVHFENARLPVSCLIGEENQGRHQVMTSASHEWAGLRRYGAVRRVFDDFTDFCNDSAPDGGQPLAEHPLVRHQLAQRRLGMVTWKLLCWNVAWRQSVGTAPVSEASAALLFGTEERLRFAEMAMEVLGPYATLRNGSPLAPLLGNIEGIHREALHLSESGTTEMHRNTIAQEGLGMPDPSIDL